MLTSQFEWNIPTVILNQVKNLFPFGTSNDAKRLFRTSKISISFIKEVPGKYYIISGIIKDLRFYESKLVFKKIGRKNHLSSNCDCHSWSSENHCPHVVCLFVSYHISKMQERGIIMDSSMPHDSTRKLGVGTGKYGIVIPGPHHLKGASGNSSYSSLRYLLCNKRIINFPIPQNFKGKLIFNLKVISFTQCIFFFKYKNPTGKEFKEISLFENIYLFNWKTGDAFHLPSGVKQFIQKLRIQGSNLDVNDLLQMSLKKNVLEFCETRIGKTPLDKIKQVVPETRLVFSRKKHTKMLFAELIFHDRKKRPVLPPPFIRHFTFKGGMLSSFKRKTDGYDFIDNFAESLEGNEDCYKKNLLASTEKNRWNELISNLFNNEKTLFYDASMRVLCLYDNAFLRLLLKNFYKKFGTLFFRYAEYLSTKKICFYQISQSALFQGLSEFYHAMDIHGLSIFYNNKEISKWNSKVRFESRPGRARWFSLELSMFDSDLNIIESADIKNSLALTSNGLTLLTKDQKELIKFMKKYTKYESKESWEEKSKNNEEEGMKTFLLPFNRIRIFELFELKKLGVEGTLTKEEEELCERLSTLEKMPEYPLPRSMEKFARPYQKIGYNWFRFLYENRLGACLADDMGLGKTLQTIGLIESVHSKIKKVLIICPVSLLINWKNEIEKFSNMEAIIYHGGVRTLPDDVKIFLTSYGVMKKEAESILAEYHFDILVLDEVQHLKNIRSQGAYAARKLKAEFRVCLTGTPVENDLAEFYNIIDLCTPGIWGDLQSFRTISNEYTRHLARKTAAPFILRRTKAQVLSDLPAKTENTVYLEMTKIETKIYQSLLIKIKARVHFSPAKKKYGEILKGLLELRQSCLWQIENKTPHPLSKSPVSRLNNIQSTKVSFLLETLEQIIEENHQAIVFSQFTKYLDIIEEAIIERHWKYSRIDGSQNIKKRQRQVDDFQRGQCPVFLISLKAGGFGLNLTAASYIFVMDPWWNPAVEAQAIDRAHRIGQKNVLTVYRPIIKGSIEEKVLELQKIKRQLFLDLLPDDDEKIFSGKLNMNDFEHLFH